MPVEVSVGPQALTINHGSTFAVTDLQGEIASDSEQGMFSNDTRFVSSYRIFTNGERCILLTSGTPTYYLARVHLMNRTFPTEDGEIAQGTLGLVITRAASEGIHEDLDVTNYGREPARFNLEIAIRSDFADLFEVKAHRFIRRGRIATELREDGTEVRTSYTNRDFRRQLCHRFLNCGSLPVYANGRATFEVRLEQPMQVNDDVFYLGIVDGALRLAAPGVLGRRITVVDADDVDRVEVEFEPARVLDPPAEDQVKLAHALSLTGFGAVANRLKPCCAPRRTPLGRTPWRHL